MKKEYDKICQKYIKAFCDKHGFDIEGVHNIADEWGVIGISDYFFYMGDIRFDVDNNLPQRTIIEWYDLTLEHYEDKDVPKINLRSFAKGVKFTVPTRGDFFVG